VRSNAARFLLAILLALFASAASANAQNTPASGPVHSEVFPGTIPPQPRPSLDPLFSPDPLNFFFGPYNDMKRKLDQNDGLRAEGSYTMFNQFATQTLSPRNDEFAGRLDVALDWTLLHFGECDTGQVVALFRSSENIGMPQSFSLSDETGSIMGINNLHPSGHQIADSLNILYYRQTFFDCKFAISLGKLHPNSWIDLSPLADNETRQFMAIPFTTNLADNGMGLWSPGVALELNMTPRWYAHSVVVSSEGKTQTDALDTLGHGNFYEAVETGCRFGEMNSDYAGNVRLTGYHIEQPGATATAPKHEGFGGSIGFDQGIGAGWATFGRYGHSEKGESKIRDFATLGIVNQHPFHRRSDMFGLAGSYCHPSAEDIREEQLYEAFYRIKVTDSIEFSPDVQWLVHPAFQPGVNNLFVLGARLRFLF
jgi:porin